VPQLTVALMVGSLRQTHQAALMMQVRVPGQCSGGGRLGVYVWLLGIHAVGVFCPAGHASSSTTNSSGSSSQQQAAGAQECRYVGSRALRGIVAVSCAHVSVWPAFSADCWRKQQLQQIFQSQTWAAPTQNLGWVDALMLWLDW
jgi:hypothetical protein